MRGNDALDTLIWCLGDPVVRLSAHARGAADLVTEIERLTTTPIDATVVRRLADAERRGALLLRAVSDERRGRLDFARQAARRLPPGARPGGSLRDADLARADLRAAPLRGADLSGADLQDADLRGADLTDAMFLTPAQLAGATGDSRTRLPGRIPRPAGWA